MMIVLRFHRIDNIGVEKRDTFLVCLFDTGHCYLAICAPEPALDFQQLSLLVSH